MRRQHLRAALVVKISNVIVAPMALILVLMSIYCIRAGQIGGRYRRLSKCLIKCLNGGTCKLSSNGTAYCQCPRGTDLPLCHNVTVWSAGKNATQSTTSQPQFGASRAVDRLGSDSPCSLTASHKHPWWRVYLGLVLAVRRVQLETKDSANASFVDVKVGIYRGVYGLCEYSNNVRFVGRYYDCHDHLGDVVALIVERDIDTQLSLCEVSVYGEPHLGSPCWSNPCGNGGSCKPVGCYYTCVCPKGWPGTNCEGTNWAYHAVTTFMQKVSTEMPEEVYNTVDGNREDMMRHGNDNLCSASTLTKDPWYLVGFSPLVEIRQILIVNRQDCCSSYMYNFEVSIIDDILCGARRHNMSGVAWKYIWCVPAAIGRIVKITFHGLQVISLCEVEVYGVPLPCRSNPCTNGKTCRRIGNTYSYECLCPPGFNGSNCTDAIPCWSTPCHNGGSCRNTETWNVYQCFCPGNATGSNCEDFKPCWSNPCHNGGSCRNTEMSNVYQCFCPGNTTGSNCEDFKPCWSNPCDNGGTCTENDASYTCNCASKWNGTNCKLKKDLTIEQNEVWGMPTTTKVLENDLTKEQNEVKQKPKEQNEVNKTTKEQNEVTQKPKEQKKVTVMSTMTKVIIGIAVGTGVVVAGVGGLIACDACPFQKEISGKLGGAVINKSLKSRLQGSTDLGDDDEEEEAVSYIWDYIAESFR